MITTDQLRSIHETYCRLTGLTIRFGFECETIWFPWQREGYTEADLALTIAYIQRLYCKQPRILAPCLRLHKLIGDLLNFAEMLAEAQKVQRVKKEETDRDSVLKATGRSVEEHKPAESAGVIMERLKLAQGLRNFNKSL